MANVFFVGWFETVGDRMPIKRPGRRMRIAQDSVLNFPLARLKGFDHGVLFADERLKNLDELILTLGHIYNDLKSSIIFGSVIAALSVGTKRHWRRLVLLEAGKVKKSSFEQQLYRYLVKVRSHGGYHYYQTGPLAQAYKQHFQGSGKEASLAFVSAGTTFEETRFFFADAAITNLSQTWKADLGRDFDSEFARYLASTHKAIRSLVLKYLGQRGARFETQEASD